MATFATMSRLRLGVVLCIALSSASIGLAQDAEQPKEKPKPPPDKGKLLPEQRAGEVWAVSVARDGRTMAVARGFSDAGAAVQLWDLTEGTKGALFESPKVIHAVAFSPDGKLLATGGFDNVLRIFDVASGKMLHELHGHQAGITSLAWSKDGKRIVTGALDTAVRLWNADDGKALETLRGHPQWVFGVAFMPDKNEVVSSCKDGTVFVWDVATEAPRLQLKGPGGAQSVAVSPDGATIASGHWDWSVRLWDSVAGKPLGVLRGHTIGVYGLAFSPDGTTLASSSGNYNKPGQRGEIKIWDVKTASAKHTKRNHDGAVWSLCFGPDGKTLVSGGADQTVRLWEYETGEQRSQLEVPIQLEKFAGPVVAFGNDTVNSDRHSWLMLGAATAAVVIGGMFLTYFLRRRSRGQAPPASAGAAETVNVECVGCHKRLKVPADVVGKKVKCPACATAFVA